MSPTIIPTLPSGMMPKIVLSLLTALPLVTGSLAQQLRKPRFGDTGSDQYSTATGMRMPVARVQLPLSGGDSITPAVRTPENQVRRKVSGRFRVRLPRMYWPWLHRPWLQGLHLRGLHLQGLHLRGLRRNPPENTSSQTMNHPKANAPQANTPTEIRTDDSTRTPEKAGVERRRPRFRSSSRMAHQFPSTLL